MEKPLYTKIFAKMLDSSIWLEDNATRIVWMTLLASIDEDGYAHFSAVKNLANRAVVTLEEAEKAVTILTSPDPDSEDKSNDGKRIERVPGGFMVLNAEKYKNIAKREHQKEQTRLRVAKHRKKEKNNEPVTPSNESVAILEVTKEVTVTKGSSKDTSNPPKGIAPCPTQKIVDLYHEKLPVLPRMMVLTANRKKHINARWKEMPEISLWEQFFDRVAESKWLTGRVTPRDQSRKPFKATLDWLVKPENFAKVIEGKYE